MRAYKCDICGNFFDKFKLLQIKKKEVDIVELSDERFPHRYDICSNCIDAIQRVIDERNEGRR